jgi:hypothetical protein
MTAEERAEVERLCRLIEEEKDNNKFIHLIYQLSSLFERSGQPQPDPKPPAPHRPGGAPAP